MGSISSSASNDAVDAEAGAGSAPTAAGEEAPIRYISFDPETTLPQQQSPLFSVLPGELRDRILSCVLAQYEDRSRAYDASTVWARPDFRAPRRIDVEVLRTCKRIYREAWYRPWAQAHHALFLTHESRAPSERATSMEGFERAAKLIHEVHGDTETASVRVYSQLYIVEGGTQFSKLLTIPHFSPREVYLTIRYTDWWHWESDSPMFIRGEWLPKTTFPASVEVFRMELESIERKKVQVDEIATQMVERWTFERADGAKLVADSNETPVTRWTGSSTWADRRWIRDESRPDEIDYYIKTVTWRPQKPSPDEVASSSPQAGQNGKLDIYATRSSRLMVGRPFLPMETVRKHGLNIDGIEAREAERLFNQALARQVRLLPAPPPQA